MIAELMAEPSFTTDEYAEATTALEEVELHLRGVAADAHQWKWVVIALHSALQGFLVLALRGSANFDVMTKKSLGNRSGV